MNLAGSLCLLCSQLRQQRVDLLFFLIFWQNEELRRRQGELEEAYQAEQAAFRRFLQFVQLIGHEFRNGLGVVKSKAQLLQLAADIGAQPDAAAPAAIERAVDRIDQLFRRWIDSEARDDGELEARPVRLPLRAVFDRISAEMPLSALHPIRIEPPPEVDIDADLDLLTLAVHNLVGNAVKYSPGGGATTIRAEATADKVALCVLDRGRGSDAGERDRIFEKYYRVRYDDGIPGFGLGLYLVRRIATLHLGTVSADANPGGGSILTLTLPRAGIPESEMSEFVGRRDGADLRPSR